MINIHQIDHLVEDEDIEEEAAISWCMQIRFKLLRRGI
jgi:hypothetical protein